MFLVRGWQMVEKGTYWEPDKGKKIVMKNSGFLPANRKERFFKLPESYLLIPVLLLGLVMSMALPFGIGLAILAITYGSYKILYFLTSECEKFLGGFLGSISFRYKPNLSFFSGSRKKTKNRRKNEEGRE